MISLKITKRERTKLDVPEVASPRDEYPYGMRLHLDNETMKKLDMRLPNVGDRFHIVAVGRVRSASENKHASGTNRDADIQIEKIDLKPVRGSATAAVKAAIKDV
jgi:hypothetical protein